MVVCVHLLVALMIIMKHCVSAVDEWRVWLTFGSLQEPCISMLCLTAWPDVLVAESHV